MPPTVLGIRALNRATLARQLLLRRARLTPLAALERSFGLQAQVPKPPFIGLWSRLESFDRESLVDLLQHRQVVRGTIMRATLHLMSASDFVTFRMALQPLLTAAMQAIARGRGMTIEADAVAKEAEAYFEKAPRTFEEVRQHLVSRFPKVNDRALGYAARMLVPLVMVPTDAPWAFPSISQFTPAESWIGKRLETGDQRPALVRRYLAAFGPATVADVQTWSGLGGLREVVEALRGELRIFHDERKRELFELADAERPAEGTPAPVRFLPEYDNLLLAHKDRRRVVADADKPKVYLPGLRVAATVLIDGFVAGVWKVELKKRMASLRVSAFARLSKDVRRELEEEGARLARFVEPDAEDVAVQIAAV